MWDLIPSSEPPTRVYWQLLQTILLWSISSTICSIHWRNSSMQPPTNKNSLLHKTKLLDSITVYYSFTWTRFVLWNPVWSLEADQCRELVKTLQAKYPDEDSLPIVLAALHYRDKKISDAEAILNGFIGQHPNSVKVQLCLAQLYLERGNIQAAIQTLNQIDSLKNKPGLRTSIPSYFCQEWQQPWYPCMNKSMTSMELQKPSIRT